MESSGFYCEMCQDSQVIPAGFVADEDGHHDCAVVNPEIVVE